MRRVAPALAALLAAGMAAAQAPSMPVPVRGITLCAADLHLSFPVAGRIADTTVAEGDLVEAGAVLMALDRRAEEIDVERRRLHFESVAEVEAAQARVETARLQHTAASRIHASSRGISREELQNRALALRLAETELATVQTRKASERLDWLGAEEALARRSLAAPGPGIVTKLIRQTGESAQAHDPVLRLCDLSRLLFVANIPVALAEAMERGQPVALRVGAQAQPVAGRVDFVSPVVDAASGLREVKVELVDPPGWVRPGLSAVLDLR